MIYHLYVDNDSLGMGDAVPFTMDNAEASATWSFPMLRGCLCCCYRTVFNLASFTYIHALELLFTL